MSASTRPEPAFEPDAPPSSERLDLDREADPLVGRTINGRFTIHSVIARGGMGKVYKAEQAPLGRICALKVLNPKYQGDEDPEFQKRFFLEAATAAKLNHPNTVTVFDYGRDGDIYYIAMEYIDGRTLYRALRDEGSFSEGRAVHVLRQVCRSLREAHQMGVIHRDLKPANILLFDKGDETDLVKVLDFGLVKDVSGKDGEDLTQAGLFMGSPKYMAPEQILGNPVSARTDIYSLGVVLYEMLAGSPPFDRGGSVKTLMAHVNEDPPPLESYNPHVAVGLEMRGLLKRCLEKAPEARFASMEELLVGLSGIDAAPLTESLRSAPKLPIAGALLDAANKRGRADSEPSGVVRSEAPTMRGSSSMIPPLPAPARPEHQSQSGEHERSITPGPHVLDEPRKRSRGVFVGIGLVAVAGAVAAVVLASGGNDGAGPVATASQTPAPAVSRVDSTPSAATPPATSAVASVAASASASAAAERKVHVESDPSGAKVLEGKQVRCETTPCDITFPADDAKTKHTLLFSRDGYEPKEMTLDAAATKLSADLKPAPAIAPVVRGQPPPVIVKPPPTGKGPGTPGYKPSPYD